MHRVILKAARALVGDDLDPVTPAWIAVEDSRILGIGEPMGSSTVTDLGDLTLMPGFIDAHVHIGFFPPLTVLRGGVTTVRDLAWPPRHIHSMARASRSGEFAGPLILAVGAMLTVDGGYPTRAGWAPEGTARVVRSVEDARAAVEEQVADGAVAVKVALNAAVGPTLDRATLGAICEAAHEHSLAVTAHIFGLSELIKALDAGVDEMAHMLMSPELIPDEVIARMVAQSVVVVPTLSIHRFRTKRSTVRNLAAFVAAGGRVVYGTDLGNEGPQPGIERKEVDRMSRSGMSNKSIVSAGTVGAAEYLGLARKGSIAPGRDADIIGVAGDPLTDAGALSRVGFVMREGKVFVTP